jgi:transcriptional regulator with XRE-family HTH domain
MSQPANHVKRLRHNKGLSQRALADLCGVSQQHLQRIEVGISPIRLDLATRISSALRVPIQKAFPALSSIVKKLSGKQSHSEPLQQQLEQAGVETEGVIWTVEFGLSTGLSKQFTLSSADKRKLEDTLGNWSASFRSDNLPDKPFFWFDSDVYSVCVNLSHVTYARTMFDPPGLDSKNGTSREETLNDAPSILVWLPSRQAPAEFEADPDDVSEQGDDEEPESGQLAELLMQLDSNMSEDGFVSFMDSDGEDVYLRVKDIAMIAIPHWLLKPEMLDEADDPSDVEEDETTVEQNSQGPSMIQ